MEFQYLKVPLAKRRKKANKTKKLAWIIGTGPSLRDIDIKKLKGHATITFNRAYIAFQEWGFDPTFYLSIDSNDIRSTYKDLGKIINKSNVKAFFFAECLDNCNHSAEHFQDQEKVSHEQMFPDLENVFILKGSAEVLGQVKFDPSNRYVDIRHYPNSGYVGLMMLCAMGYNEIAFVGCDARYADNDESNKDIIVHGQGEYESLKDSDVNHFRSDYFGKGRRFGKPNERQIIDIWRRGKEEIDKIEGLNVFSCTPNSNLNNFYKYIDFEEFIKGKR